MNKYIKLGLASILAALAGYSCRKDLNSCKPIDLVGEVVLLGSNTMLVGPVDIKIGHSLVYETGCTGAILEPLDQETFTQLLVINLTTGDTVQNVAYAVPPLPGGEDIHYETISVQFNEPGTYRICAFVDATDVFEEREESNNFSCL